MIKSNIIPLPRTAQAIANVIGRDATLALASKCKHQCLYIPQRNMADNHHIVSTIGRDLAEQLQQVFGGEVVPLPRCDSIHISQRNEAIRSARLSGKSHTEVAKKFNLSTKQLTRILYPHLAEHNRQRQRERRRAARTVLPRELVRSGELMQA